MAEDNSNRYDVAPEDAQRLNRLSEEVRGRLAEMALIIGRVAGVDAGGGAVSRFVPRAGAREDAGYDWLEMVEFLGVTGCYGSIGGQTVLEWPCGAS